MTLDEFEQVITKEYENLIRVAKRQLRKTPVSRAEEAEDIVQGVILSLLSVTGDGEDPRYARLENGPNFPGYLRDAVVSRIYNLVQHEVEVRNPTHTDIAYLSRKEVATDGSVFQLFEQVVSGFSNPKVREFLRLVFLEEWTQQEAIEHTGLSREVAWKAAERLRERMKEALSDNC